MFTSVSTDKVSVSYVDERGCYGRGTLLRWRCFSMDTVKVSSCRLVSFVCSLLHTTKRYCDCVQCDMCVCLVVRKHNGTTM